MKTRTPSFSMIDGAFLIGCGAVGYLPNPEKAKAALTSGGTFAQLSIQSGVPGARGVRWSVPAVIATTGLLAVVFAWKATTALLVAMDGKSEKFLAAALISTMPAASSLVLPCLQSARKPEATGP